MPTPPWIISTFADVNYVIDAWSAPCEAPWAIYVETMGPAALKAFITLATFGWDDVARGYFRPRGTQRRPHRPGRNRRGRPRPGFFPELGEKIGKNIPGADEVKGRKYGSTQRHLWIIDSHLQHGLFWWMVADVVNDFLFDWTSELYETEWCKLANLGRFAYRKDNGGQFITDAWHNISCGFEEYEEGPPFWGLTGGTSGTRPCRFTAGWDAHNAGDFQGAEYRIYSHSTPGQNTYRRRGVMDFDPSVGNFTAGISATIPAGHAFGCEVRSLGGVGIIRNAHVLGQGLETTFPG